MQSLLAKLDKLPAEKRLALLKKLKGNGKTEAPKKAAPPLGPQPLSFNQKRLWFLYQLEPESAVYHINAGLVLKGNLSESAVNRALAAVTARQPALRTTFVRKGDQVLQQLTTFDSVPLQVHRHVDIEGGEAGIRDLISREAAVPFDLEKEPPLRLHLHRLTADRHLLLVTMHHILSDGWSLGLFLADFFAALAGLEKSGQAFLPEIQATYGDFIDWSEAKLAGAQLDQARDYWREQLAEPLALQDLPHDKARPKTMKRNGSLYICRWDGELLQQMKSTAKQAGVTPFVLALTCFKIMLARLTGNPDQIIGTVIAGREQARFRETIGYFANTLPLRTQLAKNQSFEDALKAVSNTVREALIHGDMPFDELVRTVNPVRHLNRTPLFQVLFNFPEDPDKMVKNASSLSWDHFKVDNGTAMFDLGLELVDRGDHLLITSQYALELFEEKTIAQLMERFQRTTRAFCESLSQSVGAPSLLSDEERHFLANLDVTGSRYRDDLTIDTAFFEQAAQNPDAIALVCGEQSMTYGQVAEKVRDLAARLAGQGVVADQPVGICAHRHFDMVIGMLGIMHAGGAYIPIDPSYPSSRIALMIEDSGLQTAVLGDHIENTLFPETVTLVGAQDTNADAPRSTPTGNRHIDQAAYIIYTSGSTGRPKGVVVPHRGVLNFYTAMDRFNEDKPGTWLAVTSMSFDISVYELHWTLARGYKVVIAPADPAGNRDATVPALLQRHQATHFQCTPALLKMLAAEPGALEAMSVLKRLFVGGEAFPGELADKLSNVIPGKIFNVYGPTETTIWSSARRIEPGLHPIPIGKPLVNNRLYILDSHGRRQVPGYPGELFIGGEAVVRGYHHRAALTAERFIPDPFSHVPGARMYRTGDLAAVGKSGELAFMGRVDHQIKLRGFRIELGEIEARLKQIDGVEQAAVILYQGSGQPRLVAYFTSHDRTINDSMLRDELGKNLPAYMIPETFQKLEALPLTPNGKLDRGRLPKPAAKTIGDGQNLVAPRGETEKIIAAVWAEQLAVEQIGIHTNVFDHGAHSLMLAEVYSRITAATQRTFPLLDLFRFPTVAGLAAHLDGDGDDGARIEAAQERGAKRKAALRGRGTAGARRGAARFKQEVHS